MEGKALPKREATLNNKHFVIPNAVPVWEAHTMARLQTGAVKDGRDREGSAKMRVRSRLTSGVLQE